MPAVGKASVGVFERFDRVQKRHYECVRPGIKSHSHAYTLTAKADKPLPLASNTEAPIRFLRSAIGSTDGAGSPRHAAK
jgi:hypothetical protein